MSANRIFKTTLGLALLALGLAACELAPATPEAVAPTPGPFATTAPEPTATLHPAITRIVFWEPYALDRPQGLLLGEMIRDFETEYPTITVEIVPKSGYMGLHGAMMVHLAGGEQDKLPNLAVAFPSMIAEYAQAGVVAPLDAYLHDPELGFTEEDRADIYPGYLQAGRLPGLGRQTWAFPFVENAIGMWVNDTLLAQAGWNQAPATWDEFEQACFDVWAFTGVACYPFIESVTTFDAWLYSRGGQPLDEAGRRATFNQPPGVESLDLLRRLMAAGLAWQPDEPYGDYVAFANGQAAFTFSSTGNSLLYAEAYQAALQRGVDPFRWRQVMIPQADPANPATVLYGASFFILRGDPKKERAAWHFIRWFTATEQTARWAATLETLPLRASALAVMTDTLEAHPFVLAQVEEILPYGRPEPALSAGFELRDILYTAIISVTQGFSDTQTLLDQAARDVDTVLERQR